MADDVSELEAVKHMFEKLDELKDFVLDHPEVPESVKIEVGVRHARLVGEMHVAVYQVSRAASSGA